MRARRYYVAWCKKEGGHVSTTVFALNRDEAHLEAVKKLRDEGVSVEGLWLWGVTLAEKMGY